MKKCHLIKILILDTNLLKFGERVRMQKVGTVTVRIGSINLEFNFKMISTIYFKYRSFAMEMLVSCKFGCHRVGPPSLICVNLMVEFDHRSLRSPILNQCKRKLLLKTSNLKLKSCSTVLSIPFDLIK
jgi:hypothetical protein